MLLLLLLLLLPFMDLVFAASAAAAACKALTSCAARAGQCVFAQAYIHMHILAG
jgi:hypothetical protein